MNGEERGRGKRTRDASRTRTALLEAGLRTFAELGFDGSTVEEIARRAGVNKALVSYYFGGKRGLLDAIHAQTFALLEPGLKAVERSGESAGEDLRTFIAAFGVLARAHPDYPAMLLRGLMEGQTDPDGEFARRALTFKHTLAGILRRGVESGEFRPVDPLMTQIGILGSLLFFFATAKSRRRMFDAGKLETGVPETDQFVTHLQELVLRGLGTPS